jgi:hypothetical protein
MIAKHAGEGGSAVLVELEVAMHLEVGCFAMVVEVYWFSVK